MSGTGNFLLDQVLGAMKVSPDQIKATVIGAEARLAKLESNVEAVLTALASLSANLEKALVALSNEAPIVEKAVHDALTTAPAEPAVVQAAPAETK